MKAYMSWKRSSINKNSHCVCIFIENSPMSVSKWSSESTENKHSQSRIQKPWQIVRIGSLWHDIFQAWKYIRCAKRSNIAWSVHSTSHGKVISPARLNVMPNDLISALTRSDLERFEDGSFILCSLHDIRIAKRIIEGDHGNIICWCHDWILLGEYSTGIPKYLVGYTTYFSHFHQTTWCRIRSTAHIPALG